LGNAVSLLRLKMNKNKNKLLLGFSRMCFIVETYFCFIRTAGKEIISQTAVRTTMIYTHCVPSKIIKETKSPLAF